MSLRDQEGRMLTSEIFNCDYPSFYSRAKCKTYQCVKTNHHWYFFLLNLLYPLVLQLKLHYYESYYYLKNLRLFFLRVKQCRVMFSSAQSKQDAGMTFRGTKSIPIIKWGFQNPLWLGFYLASLSSFVVHPSSSSSIFPLCTLSRCMVNGR